MSPVPPPSVPHEPAPAAPAPPPLPSDALVPLPPHPAGVAWPTTDWPTGAAPDGVALQPLVDEAFDEAGPLAITQALLIVQHGRVIFERYAGQLEFFDRPPEPIGPGTPLLSWSMAKSVCHAAVGILTGDGALDLDAPAPVPAWADPFDPRHPITLRNLLEMRGGLEFGEDYEDVHSDALRMLFGDASHDMATFAAGHPLVAPPGSRFHYSSGATNIVSGVIARTVGPGEPYRCFLHERLFDPIGMTSARPTFDDAGTFTASSSLYATARDYARFGTLYLRDGTWDGRRILPAGWVDFGRRPRSVDPDEPDGDLHGAHWWAVRDGLGTFRAAGYEGQSIQITPALDLLVVRLGKTPQERKPELADWRARVVQAFATSLQPPS